jgi:hypothetical protein
LRGWAVGHVATAGGRGEAGKDGTYARRWTRACIRDRGGCPRWNADNDDELAWHREREIAAMEEMWEPEGELREPDA